MYGTPIGHDEPIEMPLILQNVDQEETVFGRVVAIELVISRHDRPRICPLNRGLERRKEYFVERTFIDFGVDGHAILFLIVGRKVFDRCDDLFRLDAPDITDRHLRREIRILAKAFEISSAKWRSLDID